MIALLQAGYYAEPHAARYDAATMGMFVLIIAIGIVGFIVQARLQSVFKKYSKVQFPGGLTGGNAPAARLIAVFLKGALHLARSIQAQKEHRYQCDHDEIVAYICAKNIHMILPETGTLG